MEVQEEATIMDRKCPRKLDFNAPLLSTRRATGVITTSAEMSRTDSLGTSRGICDRVPFLWELAPGKPKDADTHDDMVVPPPKLPPGRWHMPKEDQLRDNPDDDGCDGDIDDDDNFNDNDYDNNDDDFSDAMDIFSLAESVDFAEKVNGLGGANLEIEEYRSTHQSPSFMLRRFLPDATALAASSAMNRKLPSPSNFPEQFTRRVSRSYPSSKGCGLDIFFPWRMKPCGVKSPVRQVSSNVKPQWSTRKKQN
ncbi:uncharacterized protein LOC132313337 [Cornus florida]|uniref:uncharacterized protein LOC132313337 n=1 Tax=Cornus florida TaxID=4283 RepID=UPI00289C7699|nr:uncharacterized protein LOC132313337 [Cornus florida]